MLNIFRRSPKLSEEDKRFYKQLTLLLGYKPGDIELYRKAFRHKSRFESTHENNERLEYLGDSILDAVISDKLYHAYPNKQEGFLTKMRSKIVSRKTLNDIGIKLGIEEFVLSQIEQDTRKTSLIGNALEALIGAIYLDKGYEFTGNYIHKSILEPFVDLSKFEGLELDYKSKLIEWAQKEKVKLTFNTKEAHPNASDEKFHGEILADGAEIGTGKGPSKKKAEQEASKEAFERYVKKP